MGMSGDYKIAIEEGSTLIRIGSIIFGERELIDIKISEMEKLSVKYLGLDLKSPLIVSSSRLTSTIGHLKEAEDNGAGAVVLKSLFEEQINHHISIIAFIFRVS